MGSWQGFSRRTEQTELRRGGAWVEDGEDDGLQKPSRRGRGHGRGGRGRGRGRACGRSRGHGSVAANGKPLRRLRSKSSPMPSQNQEPEFDWHDAEEEWYAWKGMEAPWSCWDDPCYQAWDEAWDADNSWETVKEKKKKKKKTKKQETAGDPEPAPADCEGQEVSFARRAPPKKEGTYARWKAIKLAFEDYVGLYVAYPSKYQDTLIHMFNIHVHVSNLYIHKCNCKISIVYICVFIYIGTYICIHVYTPYGNSCPIPLSQDPFWKECQLAFGKKKQQIQSGDVIPYDLAVKVAKKFAKSLPEV